jgi:hypothetical protein
VLSALPPHAAGFLVLVALALLPGLLVVRAPWTAVPALSVSFWVLSWWWLPIAGRSHVLQALLALFGVLAVLRLLPRHPVPPPPDYAGPPAPPPVTGPTTGDVPRLRSPASLTVVGVALAMLVPVPMWPHLPGREMAFNTTSTRLAQWRDGLPASYEPLLPLAPFGAHSPALPAVAADASILSGLDPGRSVVVAGLLSAALLLIGFFGLLATRLRPASAALAALLGLAAAPEPGFFAVWGEGGPVLALALGLSAATLLIGHTSRPSAVAAGMLLAAAALAQPLLTLVIAITSCWAARRGRFRGPLAGTLGRATAFLSGRSALPRSNRPPRAEDTSSMLAGSTPRYEGPSRALGRDDPVPVVLASGARDAASQTRRLALALGVAFVLAAPALLRLARALSPGEAWGVLRSPRPSELADLATGLALVALATVLAHLLVGARSRPGLFAGVLVAVSAALLLVAVHLGPAAGQVGPADLRALAALEREARPTEAVCAPPEVVDWVPALAGRPVGGFGEEAPRPWVPPAFREEARRGFRGACKKMDAKPRAP